MIGGANQSSQGNRHAGQQSSAANLASVGAGSGSRNSNNCSTNSNNNSNTNNTNLTSNNENNNNNNNSNSNQSHHHQHLVNHRTSNANQQLDADDDYLEDHGMRIGNNYQAELPQFIAFSPAPEYYEEEKAIRVWSPYNKIPNHILDEYINKAKDKFFYNTEQALGMLSWHKFDLNRAYADLPNFVPYPNEWSVEDKVLFEQAYQFHEKQFTKIRQMLPDKSMANLINYYYGWKKTRTRASLMERQTRKFAARKANDSNGTSDEDDADAENEAEGASKDDNVVSMDTDQAAGDIENNQDGDDDNDEEPNIDCCLCSRKMRINYEQFDIIIETKHEKFCVQCYNDWRAGKKELSQEKELGDCFYQPAGEPRKMLFSYSDVLNLVEGMPDAGELMLKTLDAQVEDVKRDIQTKKQTLSQVNEKIQPIVDQISDLNVEEFSDILPEYNPTKEFSNEDNQLILQGLRRYGADFSAIADIVRTKSPDAIKSYYVSQKERLNLKMLVDEFDKNKRFSTVLQGHNMNEQPQTTTRISSTMNETQQKS